MEPRGKVAKMSNFLRMKAFWCPILQMLARLLWVASGVDQAPTERRMNLRYGDAQELFHSGGQPRARLPPAGPGLADAGAELGRLLHQRTGAQSGSDAPGRQRLAGQGRSSNGFPLQRTDYDRFVGDGELYGNQAIVYADMVDHPGYAEGVVCFEIQ